MLLLPIIIAISLYLYYARKYKDFTDSDAWFALFMALVVGGFLTMIATSAIPLSAQHKIDTKEIQLKAINDSKYAMVIAKDRATSYYVQRKDNPDGATTKIDSLEISEVLYSDANEGLLIEHKYRLKSIWRYLLGPSVAGKDYTIIVPQGKILVEE